MGNKTGKIEKFRKDRKAFAIDDVWYSAFKASWMGEAQSGDTVSFEYTEKGDFKNITEGTLKVTEQKPAGSSGGGGKKGGYSKGEFRSVPQLVRQEAVTQAIELIKAQGLQYVDGKQSLTATLYFANVISAYVDGDISVDGIALPSTDGSAPKAAAPAKSQVAHQPTPDPEPEPQPEPEPASPAASLDAFLGD